MLSGADSVSIPAPARLHLGRAAVQVLADAGGIDLVHIKGDAVHPSLRPDAQVGTDIDVLVRPRHVDAMDARLRSSGWSLYSTFTNGSPFGHAQTYHHQTWGYLDLHRSFPGIGTDPSSAFAMMWAGRERMDFAGIACAVPEITAQAVVLLLNAARSPAFRQRDITAAWDEAPPETRRRIEAWMDALDANVAFAVARGELDAYRGDRRYRLWRSVSQGGTRAEEWLGRVLAAPGWRARLAVLTQLVRVNPDRLAHALGRPPTRSEVAGEFFARASRGVRSSVPQVLRREKRR